MTGKLGSAVKKRLAALKLPLREIDVDSKWYPARLSNLLALAATPLRVTADGKGVELAHGETTPLTLTHAPMLGTIDECEMICDLLQLKVVIRLSEILRQDPCLAENIRNFTESMKGLYFLPLHRLEMQGRSLLDLLLKLGIDDIFAAADDYPLSTLLEALLHLSNMEPSSEVGQEYAELNELFALDTIPFGFTFVVDASDLTVNLFEGGVGDVYAYYASGVHAELERVLREKQESNFCQL